MRFPANHKIDKRDIIYNDQIMLQNIPAEAYEYVVNGKSAIEWIMERYQLTTHKESGIVNDPNDWAREQDKPKYILDLLLSVISVSIKTVEIVKGLPKVEFEVLND
jgi:predicted helicase